MKILDLVGSVDLFRELQMSQAKDLLECAQILQIPANTTIIQPGTPGDSFYIISSGSALVECDGLAKTLGSADYFGETSLVTGELRSARVTSLSELEVVAISRYDFFYLFRSTNIINKMLHLATVRSERSWLLLSKNSLLSLLSVTQKTELQAILHKREVAQDAYLWKEGEEAVKAFLVDEGTVRLTSRDNREGHLLGSGCLLADVNAMRSSTPHSTSVVALQPLKLFTIRRRDLLEFLTHNPGLALAFLGSRFIE
eukprot:GILI01011793.1.p1 GENE.GILI01011793.1~~GILI01011793.1.p1  ORF type:complete len:279 (+),score=91.95 GILI01011793.1:70-837(+)